MTGFINLFSVDSGLQLQHACTTIMALQIVMMAHFAIEPMASGQRRERYDGD
jgi:hypothetical protein